MNNEKLCMPGEAVCAKCGKIYHINCGCCDIPPIQENEKVYTITEDCLNYYEKDTDSYTIRFFENSKNIPIIAEFVTFYSVTIIKLRKCTATELENYIVFDCVYEEMT